MSRPASAIIATVCLLAVWIATPILSAAHVMLVQHSFCAEHERLEEGADVHASGIDSGASDTSELATVSPGHPVDSEPGHEGCAFGEDFPLEDYFLLPTTLDAEPAMASEASQLLRALAADQRVPLLLVAPKNSPPQFA